MKNFTFNKEEHYYELDGKRLYGVTTVLGVIAKPALIPWAVKMATDYVENHVGEFWNPEFTIGDSGEHFSEEALHEVLMEAKSAHRKKKEDAGESGTTNHEIIEGAIKAAITTNSG